MTQENNNYAEGMLKGRMAETLVEELLRKCGNKVYRFGYEAILQNLTQLKEGFDRHSEVGEQIRAIPDLVVVDKDGNTDLVEVKFRWSPTLHEKDFDRLERIKNYWGSKVIFVNCSEKPYFRITVSPYIENGKLNATPLKEMTTWNIDPIAYDEFEVITYKYLSPTLLPETRKSLSVSNINT